MLIHFLVLGGQQTTVKHAVTSHTSARIIPSFNGNYLSIGKLYFILLLLAPLSSGYYRSEMVLM